jgi:nitrous oxidase accessory protein
MKADNLSILREVPPNSRVIVNGGIYKGKIVIDRPLELIGKNYPITDGQREGHIVLVKAPCNISVFTLRNYGTNLLSEDSGIMVENVSGVFIEGNKIEDVLFGIYLKNSQSVVIKDNFISGKDLPLSMRGDGIRLWYSRSVTLENNTVVGVRDVVIWYSENVLANGNKVFYSRYGLHYMYSNGNILEGDEFIGNIVGTFIMFSRKILVKNNVFGSSKFLTGIGICLKDASYIVITQNLIADNTIGIYFANSSEFTGEIINSDIEDSQVLEGVSYGNIIRKNVFAFNTKCMSFLPPAYPNLISENTF